MRLAVVVRRASPPVAQVLDVIASVVVAIFALEPDLAVGRVVPYLLAIRLRAARCRIG